MRATAAGSLPGEDFAGALRTVAELFPELAPMPELPARGVGADMVGRALGLIDDLAFDVQPAGWRLTQHSGREHRRARALWRQDLDQAEEALQEFGGVLKVGLAGPMTLAAAVERPTGDRLLADHGARRELAEALFEGAQGLATELGRRLPGAGVRLQLDEPGLVAVRTGAIPTSSGFSRHRRVDDAELVSALQPFSDAVLHCCAAGEWLDVAARAGFGAAYVDARATRIDDLGTWRDAGRELVLGVVDTTSAAPASVDDVIRATQAVTREIGAGDDVWVAPACGLAGWSMRDAAAQLRDLARAAELLDEERG